MNENQDICRIIEENLHNFYFRIAGKLQLDHRREPAPAFIRNDPGKWPSFVLGPSDPMEQESILQEVAAGMGTGIYPPFWITREPELADAFLENTLRYNIRPVSRWTGMSLEMDDYRTDPFMPRGAVIQTISKDQGRDEWIDLVNREIFRREALTGKMIALMTGDNAFRLYSLTMERKMFSTALAFLDGEIAGLYFIATGAEQRKQGFGKAVTAHAIKDCFQQGARRVVLHATSAGEPLYRNLGFKPYCHFDILWYFA
jgi:GNAT superfamily N-acetyltransferase